MQNPKDRANSRKTDDQNRNLLNLQPVHGQEGYNTSIQHIDEESKEPIPRISEDPVPRNKVNEGHGFFSNRSLFEKTDGDKLGGPFESPSHRDETNRLMDEVARDSMMVNEKDTMLSPKNLISKANSDGDLKTAVKQNENAMVEEEEKAPPLSWAIKLGAPQDKPDGDFILEQLQPKDCDVYPLSISYTPSQKRRMKIIRIITFILCFYLVVPFDLYIPSHQRIGYFGTDVQKETISFDQLTDNTYTILLTNCKVHLKALETPSDRSFQVQYGFEFGTLFTSNSTGLQIKAKPTETCIVNLFLPTSVSSLPKFVFNISGTDDNMIIEDAGMSGKGLTFGNGLQIGGDSVYLYLNNHYISQLNVSTTFGIVNLVNVTSKLKNVSLTTGSYTEILAHTQKTNYYQINQTQANICLYGPYMSMSSSKAQCLLINSPASITNATAINCTLTGYMCSDQTTGCSLTSSSAADQYINITVADGGVQIKYMDSTSIKKYQSVYQIKSSLTFSQASLNMMNVSINNFETDLANDRIAILQTVGPSYEKVWIYTNKLAIIQAQYWPLAWGSIGLLRPVLEKYKVVMIDYQCPARSSNLVTDKEVSDFYYLKFPTTTISLVGFVQGYSTFYEVVTNDSGDSKYRQILFNDNTLIVACFAIAGIIALVGALFAVQLAYMGTKVMKTKYNKYLQSQKQLAITKQQAVGGKDQGAAQTQNIAFEFEGQNKIVEERGLCSTRFIKMEPSEIRKCGYAFNFSLYQIPALYLDFTFRKKINSLQTFLMNVTQSKVQFSSKKMKQANKKDVSMLVSELQTCYSDFCQRNGYVEIDIEKSGKGVLKGFQITIESQEGKSQPAYVNIKFKTAKEKLEQEADVDASESTIKRFLHSECRFSSFENDYIFFEDLKKAYLQFCKDQGIQESQQEQIIGSDDLTNFGSTVKEKDPPKILVGIKKGKPDNRKDKSGYPGIVRRQASLKASIMAKFMSVDGLVPNAALAVVHFIIILVVPLVNPLITYLALCEMTRVQQGVYQRSLSFLDFYATNRLDPWWDSTPYLKEAMYVHIYVLVYLFFAYIELISFYMTGYDNQGKFPIKFSKLKRFVMIVFYILLGIFIFYYVAMLWFALVWALLAAILNPSRLLPYTAAALVLIGTVTAKLLFFKLKYEMTMSKFEKIVTDKLGGIVQQSLSKIKSKSSAATSKIPGAKGASGGSSESSGDGGSKEPKEDMTNSEVISRKGSKKLDGLNPNLIGLSTAVIVKEKTQIKEKLQILANDTKIDYQFIQAFSDIVLSDFNPQKTTKQSSFGTTELAIKKMFSTLYPNLNIDLMDKLISLVLEKDPAALIQLLKRLDGIDTQLFEIMCFIKQRDRANLKKSLFELHKKLATEGNNEQVYELFRILHDLRDGEIHEIALEQSNLNPNDNKVTNQLGFNLCFPILCLIALNQKSSTLNNIILTQSIKEIIFAQGMLDNQLREEFVKNCNTNKQEETMTEKLYLAFQYLIKGESIDMKRLTAMVSRTGSISSDMLEILHQCSQNSGQSFEQVLYKIQATQTKDILMEFYDMMQQKNVKFVGICNRFQIPEDNKDAFTQLFYLLYRIMKYELLVTKTEKNQNLSKELHILRGKIKEALDEIEYNEGISFYEFNEFKEYYEKPAVQALEITNDKQENSQNNLTLEGDEDFEHDEKVKNILKIIFSNKLEVDHKHKTLWSLIIEQPSIQTYMSDEIMTFIRCHAFILLKTEQLISMNDESYIKCYKEVASCYEITDENFEFLIDIVTGNPLDIFNLQSKQIEYSIKQEITLKGNFDLKRLNLLSSILKANRKTLTATCLHWYHQYKYFQQGKGELQRLIKLLNLNNDFVQIIATKRLTQSEDNQAFYVEECIKQINAYLKAQIKSRNKSKNKQNDFKKDLKVVKKYFLKEEQGEDSKFNCITEMEYLNKADTGVLLQVMDALIRLKSGDKRIYSQILRIKDMKHKYVVSLQKVFEVAKQLQPHTVLNSLTQLAKTLPLFSKVDNWENCPDIKASEQDKFIQFNLIIHASQFQTIYNKADANLFQMNKSLVDIVNIASEESKETIYYIEDKDFRKCIQALYDNNYFNDIASQMFGILAEGVNKKTSQLILGVLFGASLGDKNLLRTSVMALLKNHDLKLKILEGLAAVLMSDIEAQEEIKEFCKQLEIDGGLLIKLMDLIQPNPNDLPSVIMELLQGVPPDESKICTSLLYAMKGDLSMLRNMTSKIGVDAQQVMPFLAAAIGNLSILGEFYSFIQEKLQITSQKGVRYLFQLAHGHSSAIYQLSSARSANFWIHDPELVDSLYTITFIGKRMLSKHVTMDTCKQMGKVENSITKIGNKLGALFGLSQDQNSNLVKSLKVLVKACWGDAMAVSSILKKLQKNTDKNSIWFNSSKEESNSKLSEYYTDKEIVAFLISNIKGIVEENNKIQEHIDKKQKELIKNLKNIILPEIKRLYTGKEVNKDAEEEKKGEKIKENKKQDDKAGDDKKEEDGDKQKLKKRKSIKKQKSEKEKLKEAFDDYYNLTKTKEDEQSIKSLENDTQKQAYKVGCTFGLSLFRRISQPFYYCQTCNEQVGNENLGICITCVIFCHAGHKIVEAGYGHNTRSFCDCGSGKFNKCATLNDQCPLKNLKTKENCSVLRNTFKNLQDEAIKKLQDEDIEYDDEIDNYKNRDFLKDLSKALQFPNFFESMPDLTKDLEALKGIEKGKDGIVYLKDCYYNNSKCLAENLILLALGQVTNSLLSMMGTKKSYSKRDYQNQNLYATVDMKSSTNSYYSTIACFVSIAQVDFSRLQQFGEGLGQVLGEIGTKEQTAVDKFSNILRLANGGKLPKYDPDLGSSSKPCRNSYARLFQQLFGINGKSIMVLHKLMTLSNQELVDALGFKDELEEGENDDDENGGNEDLDNLQQWVDDELFSNFLQLNDKSIDYCKNIIGLYCKKTKAFDFIAKEKDIGPIKASYYKTLLFTKKQSDLQPIFAKLKKFIPEVLNTQLRKVWKGNRSAIVEFIVHYLKVDKGNKSWKKVESFDCSNEAQKQQYKYLISLYQLMTSDLNDVEKQIDYVFTRFATKKLKAQEKVEPDHKRKVQALLSIAGMFYNDGALIPKIANAFEIKELSEKELTSFLSIIDNSYGNHDLKLVIKTLTDFDITNNDILNYSRSLLLAAQGDLISLAKIDDEILQGQDIHIKSTIAGIINGVTKFDSLLEGSKPLEPKAVKKYRNLLKRELYAVFEKISTEHFKDHASLEKYIEFCFDEKVPSHLLLLQAEDKSFVEKIFDQTEEFLSNQKEINKQTKKYLKTFIDFMNPFYLQAQIKPLLKQALRNAEFQKDLEIRKIDDHPDFETLQSLEIQKVNIPDMGEKIKEDNENSYKTDILDLTQLFYNCFSLDIRITQNFYNFLVKIYDKSPIQQSIFELQQKMIDGKPIYDNLISAVAVMIAQCKKEEDDEIVFDDKDKQLIELISLWMEAIMIMLSKEKTTGIDAANFKFKQIVKLQLKYYKDDSNHPLVNRKDSMLYIVDTLVGLMSILKQDFVNMRQLAIKLGGFPSKNDKIDAFFKTIKSQKNQIKFEPDPATTQQNNNITSQASNSGQSSGTPSDATNQGSSAATGALQSAEGAAGGLAAQALGAAGSDNPVAMLLNPKLLFVHFGNKRGTMGFEEFQNFARYLGLNISHAKMLQIFSAADKDKTGELTPQQFKKSLSSLKQIMVYDSLEQMGLSINDLAISFIFTIVILLLLMFAFIFVGIEAFAPASSFSSVTNTSLPLTAGGSVNKGGGDDKKEDLNKVADDQMS